MQKEQLGFHLQQDVKGPIAGIDEAGRGPLAGDVVAAAVILRESRAIAGLADSKTLSESRRSELYLEIITHAAAWSVGRASVEEIDHLNILQATLLAMKRAAHSLEIQPGYILVDGNRLPQWLYPAQAVIKGDSKVPAIAAASIVAKVTRDRELLALDKQYPGYGFSVHKGYPTKAHIEALENLGPTPAHRKSFSPVARLLG